MSRLRLPLLSLVLVLTACAEAVEPEVYDDMEEGDSLAGDELAGDKADGYTVPTSLALDKNRVVYLTFDDGPSPALTPRILDTLAAAGVKATFFVTGRNIAGNEEILRRAAREGHIIGNHQWVHSVASQTYFKGYVERERDLIRDTVGAMPQYFRYPYGAMTAPKEAILKQLGYAAGGIGWDIDTLDWDFGADGVASRAEVPAAYKKDFEGWILYQLERRKGGVILFHDVQSITANRLGGIIQRIKDKGYRFGELPR